MERWRARVRALTLQLCQLPSVTNTQGEADFALRLRDILAQTPYFQEWPEHLRVEPTTEDLHQRSNLYALVRGVSASTVVLAGHYDVVSVENYGPLQPWAFDPEALLPRLMAALDRDDAGESDRRALQDLRSGEFLPGRGVLDMKSGVAAGIAVLERFAALSSGRRGNLLLVATPDEEQGSHGMRSAALRLPELAREWGIQLEAAINLDSTVDEGDGSDGRAVFTGSVGKLLASVFVVGRETHAGSPFAGVNANLLAAEVTRRVECNAALADVSGGEVAPPPISLKQIDLKAHYDVTSPSAAWCYFNVLTHQKTPRDVLREMLVSVEDALCNAMCHLQEQARRYGELAGSPVPAPRWQPRVLTFSELHAHVQQHDRAAAEALDELARQLAADPALDTPQLSCRITGALWERGGLTGPAAVVGFAGLHYPSAFVDPTSTRDARLRTAVTRQAAAVARDSGQAIRLRPFFPGISDMSFLGGTLDQSDEALVVANTPAWGSRIRFDYGAVRALDLPVVNAGPWGRDYHQRTERVNVHYAFEVVPELIWRIVDDLLTRA